MGFFCFDESIQDKGGFVIGAFVYSRSDMTPIVFAELAEAGLRPGVEEFKSGSQMSMHPKQAKARQSLRGLFQNVRVGVVIVPVGDRQGLGNEAIAGLAKVLEANSLSKEPHKVFIDHGIVVDGWAIEKLYRGPGRLCEIHLDQDSRMVGGIQVADLAAHSMGVMLLEHQGLLKKVVKAGENSGYDPELEIEVGFELWASLRYAFFKSPQPNPGPIPDDPVGDLIFDVENYGLHIAGSCDDALRRAAIERFGECYLGRIH
jgi:hypothetical protein